MAIWSTRLCGAFAVTIYQRTTMVCNTTLRRYVLFTPQTRHTAATDRHLHRHDIANAALGQHRHLPPGQSDALRRRRHKPSRRPRLHIEDARSSSGTRPYELLTSRRTARAASRRWPSPWVSYGPRCSTGANPHPSHVGLVEPTLDSRGHASAPQQQRRATLLQELLFIESTADLDDDIEDMLRNCPLPAPPFPSMRSWIMHSALRQFANAFGRSYTLLFDNAEYIMCFQSSLLSSRRAMQPFHH
jgi:hypothetical protein